MKKRIITISIILFVVLVLAAVYLYFNIQREIHLYEEYKVHYDGGRGDNEWLIICSEYSRKMHMKQRKINMPEIDFKKYNLLWTSGRRIKKITYRIISKYKWHYGIPKGIAVFEEKPYLNTYFFYKINKVDARQDWSERKEFKE